MSESSINQAVSTRRQGAFKGADLAHVEALPQTGRILVSLAVYDSSRGQLFYYKCVFHYYISVGFLNTFYLNCMSLAKNFNSPVSLNSLALICELNVELIFLT